MLGIGASSSAAYTLRKHYTKHLLAYECHFDRGGVDPQPIINQVEAGSKKKGSKGTASVPSPGRLFFTKFYCLKKKKDLWFHLLTDSFLLQVLPILKTLFPLADRAMLPWTAMEAIRVVTRAVHPVARRQNIRHRHPGHPVKAAHLPPIRVHLTVCKHIDKVYIHCYEFYNNFSRFTFQGIQQGSYQNTGSYQNYPQDQYIRPQANALSQQGEFSQPYSPRSHYPPYVPDVDR